MAAPAYSEGRFLSGRNVIAGIDSYSYHRLFGEVRPGERSRLAPRWDHSPVPVLEHAQSIGAEAVFFETCYLPDAERVELPETPLQTGFSWGHGWPDRSHGLDGGRSWNAEVELASWIDAAERHGHDVLRITAGSPASRGSEPAHVLIERLAGPVRRAADHAAAAGLRLALENHGDLRWRDLLDLFERVDRPDALGVCLDNVNLLRVGDDMLEGVRRLAPHTFLVHLKDHEAGDPMIPGGPVCTALGDGIAPLDEIIGILAEARFDGAVCVEIASLGGGDVDELVMVERSVTWLRENLSSPQHNRG